MAPVTFSAGTDAVAGVPSAHAAGMPVGADVERRTLRGAVEAVLITGLAAPAGFGIVVVLGRVSPETLGFYALITLFVGLFAGFLSFGGPALATRAAADAGSQFNRGTLIQAFVAPPVAGVVAAALAFAPGVRSEVGPLTLVALAVSATMWIAAQGATTAGLRFGATSLLQNLPTLLQFPVFVSLAFAAPEFLRRHAHTVVIWSYVATMGLIGLGYVLFLVKRRARGLLTSGPARLTRLAIAIQATVILTFLFESGERIAALTAPDGLVTLGKYFAGVQVAYMVRRIPAIVGQAALPGFAALRGSSRSLRMRGRAAIGVGHLSFAVASGLVVASPLIDSALGDRYRGTAGVIVIVAVACAATAAWPLDASYATAEDRLGVYQISLLVGSVAFVPLLFSQTLLVLALCRASALVLAYVVLLTGLRGWTADRVAQLVVIAVLGSAEAAIVHVARAPSMLLATWVLGLLVYAALIGGQRRWQSAGLAATA